VRFFQWPLVVALAALALSDHGALSAQAKEVTGTFTIEKTAHTMTNAYAFARRSGAGEDQGLLILFTSAPVPAEIIRGYINNGWIKEKALKGELTAIEILLRPGTIEEARTAAGVRNCCQSNFYAKGLISEDLSLSISGTQQLSLAKTEAGRIAGRVQLPLTKNPPAFGGGATIQYDLTFNTKVLTSKSMFGPWTD
jgi:hypothetical protein